MVSGHDFDSGSSACQWTHNGQDSGDPSGSGGGNSGGKGGHHGNGGNSTNSCDNNLTSLNCLIPIPTSPSTYSMPLSPTTVPENLVQGTKPLPYLKLSIYVDWTKVDGIDVTLDGISFLAEPAAGVAAAVAQPEISAGAEIVGKISNRLSFLKAGIDLFKGEPKGMSKNLFFDTAEKVAKLVFRAEGFIPVIGMAGNGVSLYLDLKPQGSIEWVMP